MRTNTCDQNQTNTYFWTSPSQTLFIIFKSNSFNQHVRFPFFSAAQMQVIRIIMRNNNHSQHRFATGIFRCELQISSGAAFHQSVPYQHKRNFVARPFIPRISTMYNLLKRAHQHRCRTEFRISTTPTCLHKQCMASLVIVLMNTRGHDWDGNIKLVTRSTIEKLKVWAYTSVQHNTNITHFVHSNNYTFDNIQHLKRYLVWGFENLCNQPTWLLCRYEILHDLLFSHMHNFSHVAFHQCVFYQPTNTCRTCHFIFGSSTMCSWMKQKHQHKWRVKFRIPWRTIRCHD